MATATPAVAAHKSFFSSVGSFFKKVGYYVSEGFQKIFGANASKAFAVSALALLKSDLGKLAFAAVQEAEKLAAGTDKRAVAYKSIVTQAIALGLDAKASIVNMLIEMAVQAVNGAFGQKV